MKRGLIVSCLLLSLVCIWAALAEDDSSPAADSDGECGDFDCDDLEMTSPGISPDSPIYFIDELFDRLGDDIGVKEEKFAEIKAMVEKGDYASARKALRTYLEYARSVASEADPDKKEEIAKSAETIKKALRELESEIPKDNKKTFYDDILNEENKIITAVEISDKIRELCEQLAKLDVVQYGEVCVTEDNSPKWQKELDKELSKEQRTEAKKFGEIMSECFETSGQTCRCDEVPFTDFANACKKAAPLAVECGVYKDQTACEKLDSLKMPKLPKHLQDVMDKLESATESKYDIHMPKECVGARVKTKKECRKLMITEHSPEECRKPLLDSGCDNEMECREICDLTMMEIHSPECIEEGIKDPEECQDFLFNINHRPEDCVKNMIHDARDCKAFLESTGKYQGIGLKETKLKSSVKIDFDCKSISDPMKRLECYDGAAGQVKAYKGIDDPGYDGPCMTEADWKRKKEECRSLYGSQAGDEPIRGDSGKGYECVVDAKCVDFSYKEEYNAPEECKKANALSKEACRQHMDDVSKSGARCDDCVNKCPDKSGQRLRGTGCSKDGCECYYEDIREDRDDDDDDDRSDSGSGGENSGPAEGGGSGGESGSADGSSADESGFDESSGSDESSESGDSGGSGGGDSGGSGGGDSGISGGGDSGGSGGGDSGGSGGGDSGGSGGGDSGGSGGGGSAITGQVISDKFLDYWYR